MDSEQTISNEAIVPLTTSGSLSQATDGVEDEVIISAIKVNKYFGDKHVLKDVDFEVRKKEVVALIVSPATTARMVANAIAEMNAKKIDPAKALASSGALMFVPP